MQFNPLPYFREIQAPAAEKKYDVVFVGKDKGRLPALIAIRNKMNDIGLKTNFVITPNRRYHSNPEYSKAVSYFTSVALAAEGRAVLDYIEVTDSGQSLRIVEALFLREKIITNSTLISQYDFYDPDNIFILGVDPIEKLHDFLNTPYRDIPEEIVMNYDFDRIIQRFFDQEQTYSSEMMRRLEETGNA